MIKRVDENGLVHLVTNIRKPRKWRRFEYLLSSGTLWIDTGYIPNNFTKIDTKFDTHRSDSGLLTYITSYRFGDYRTTNGFQIMRYKDSSLDYDLVKVGIGWPSGANQVKNLNIGSNSVLIDFKNKECYINGSIYTDWVDFSLVNMDLCTNTLPIFAFKVNGTNEVTLSGVSHPGKVHDASVYTFKIWDNDVLVRDFVPAQYNGQYGMWDLVEDKFYGNSGTGSFTVGPEIKNYDEIYEVRKTTSLLPAGVELYDYILSSGTLYIDTGWITDYTKSFEVESKYNASSTGSRACILSSHSATSALSLEVTTGSRYYLHDGNLNNIITITMGADHTSIFSYGGGTWKHQVDGGTANTGSASYSDSAAGSALMFCDRAKRTYIFNKIFKMYYLSIKENGVLIRNFLPCTYLGEPGMWDTVENKFYRNQGTGQFTLGNKITLKEYEYLESSKIQYIDTNFYPNLNSGSELKVQILPSSGAYSKLLYTDYSNANEGSILWGWDLESTSKFRAAYYKNLERIIINGTFNNNDIYLLKINKNIYSINEITVLTNSTINFLSSSTVKLFAKKSLDGSISGQIAMRLYYCKLHNDNQLVRDFIPVSYNGTPGLWDKVEWKFYANAGSGSFTLGPEKASGIFPINFGTLEYSEGSNISSSLLTVTGSGKTSTPPRAAINACTLGYKVEFSNVSVAKTYVIELDFTWTGNWGFTSDGSPMLTFLGATKASGGSYEWKGANYINLSLNNRQSLLGLVQSSPSGGGYHYIGVFTIPANARVGYDIGTRCDYSDGNGSFTYGNLKIYSYN